MENNTTDPFACFGIPIMWPWIHLQLFPTHGHAIYAVILLTCTRN